MCSMRGLLQHLHFYYVINRTESKTISVSQFRNFNRKVHGKGNQKLITINRFPILFNLIERKERTNKLSIEVTKKKSEKSYREISRKKQQFSISTKQYWFYLHFQIGELQVSRSKITLKSENRLFVDQL